jgi:NADH:ubiquinone reductase (H+-translocating)
MAEARKAPHVVIVGAGFGGLSAAQALCGSGARVTIVDQQNHHLFQPLLYQVATAGLSPADIAAPIRSTVKRHKNTHVLLDRVVGVDKGRRQVLLADGAPLQYDQLILATGARHGYFGRDDWARHAPGLKTIDDATRLRRKILLALEHAETETDPAQRRRLLTFVIVGGGPTGVEMAGAIAELTRHSVGMDFRSITPDCARIVLIEANDRLLRTFPPKLSENARHSLEKLGVEIRLNDRVMEVDAGGVTSGGERIEAATIMWAAGVRASPAAQWLDVPSDPTGRVAVEPDMSVPGHPEIFVIGDTAFIRCPKGEPVPGVAPAAKQQGRYVARVIARRIAGKAAPGPFRYRNYGNLATIGRKRAVADFELLRVAGPVAWLLWCVAHIYFLVGFRNRLVVGANWLWNYITFDRGARLITGVDIGDGEGGISTARMEPSMADAA